MPNTERSRRWGKAGERITLSPKRVEEIREELRRRRAEIHKRLEEEERRGRPDPTHLLYHMTQWPDPK